MKKLHEILKMFPESGCEVKEIADSASRNGDLDFKRKGFTLEIINATKQVISINLFTEGFVLPKGVFVHGINNTAVSYPELLGIAQSQNFSGEILQINADNIPLTIHTKEGDISNNTNRVLSNSTIVIDGYKCYLSIILKPGNYVLQLL